MNIKSTNRFALICFTIAAVCLSGLSAVRAQTTDSAEIVKISTKQRESIESVVHDYLLKNPSIIREALQALEMRERRQQQEKVAQTLRSFKKEIFFDPGSPVLGNPNGDVTLVVFFDYNCGYCKQTLPALAELIENDPQLRIVYKEYPIMGQASQVAAQAAMASTKQGKYAQFHDALMKAETIDEDSVKTISEGLGINYATLKKDMGDPELNAAILRNLNLANSLGIGGTPSYIVGNQIIPGAIDTVSLTRLIAFERSQYVKPRPVGKAVGGLK
ncbi:MAG: DsbA family protein [Pyrinomonadaceae bacterium]|nr:DsbA family protein [Pyrinomonadaceae bacterium]